MESNKLERQDMLISFIEEMAQNPLDDDFDCKKYVDTLSKIYLDDKDQQTFRHSYAYITERIYEMDPEAIAVCIDNIDKLISRIQINNIKNPLEKLRDHIQLESLHISRMKSAKHVIDSVPGLLKTASEAMSKYKLYDASFGIMSHRVEQLDKDAEERRKQFNKESETLKDLSQKSEAISKEIKEYNTQMVTILGIFAGVVFAFSGGFSLIGGALANIHNIHGIQTLFFLASILSIGLILYDVVYALLHFVGKYCNKEPQKVETFTKCLNLICTIMVIALLILYFGLSFHSGAGTQQDIPAYTATPDEAIEISTTTSTAVVFDF